MIYSCYTNILKYTVIITLAILTFNNTIANPGKRHTNYKTHGFIDFNYYYDTRDFNSFNINILADINERWHYFSTNTYFNRIKTTENFDMESFYSEQNLSYLLIKEILPTDINMQWVTQTGTKNDILRFGPHFRVADFKYLKKYFNMLHSYYSVSVYPIQIDKREGYNWQVEHTYSIAPNLWDDRFYLAGFLDHNVHKKSSRIITGHQFGLRVIDQFHLVAEFRHNDFRRGPDKRGIGLGLEYKIIF